MLVPVSMLALALVVAPLPAVAGEPTAKPTSAPSIAAAAQQAVSAQVKAPARSQFRAQSTATTKTDLGSGSFFKSTAGIITLAVVGAGVGYAIYSSSNDRIKSPGK
jgi:hypothetical protein